MGQKLQTYIVTGVNTKDGFGQSFTGINYNVTLAANVEQHLTVPEYLPAGGGLVNGNTPTYFVVFKVGNGGADVFGAYDATAAVPTGTISLSESQMISDKDCYFVRAGHLLSLIANDTVNVTMSFYFKS